MLQLYFIILLVLYMYFIFYCLAETWTFNDQDNIVEYIFV